MIPTAVHIARSYEVSGDTIYEGGPAIVVDRIDLIQAHGDGAEGQHRLVLDAAGSGTARYYLNPASGQIGRIITENEVGLAVNTSARVSHFRQNLKQEFILIR